MLPIATPPIAIRATCDSASGEEPTKEGKGNKKCKHINLRLMYIISKFKHLHKHTYVHRDQSITNMYTIGVLHFIELPHWGEPERAPH